jgi:hypothetical protein
MHSEEALEWTKHRSKEIAPIILRNSRNHESCKLNWPHGIERRFFKRLRYGTLTVETKKALLGCECLVDSTSLIGSNGRSASVLEDRRQTALV